MTLTSDLFKKSDKLNQCLVSDAAHIVANEPPARRGVNDKGAHVALLHTALRRVMGNVSFGLEEATETYGPKTAEVIRQFKASHNPPILNKQLRQTTPDNIVGKQTIFFLDQALQRKPAPAPNLPPPVQPETTNERLVFKTTVELKLVQRLPNEDGDGFFNIGTALNTLPGAATRIAQNPIEGANFDDGVVQLRQVLKITATHVMKTVDIKEVTRQLETIVQFGSRIFRFEITRTYRYAYGPGAATDLVTVTRVSTFNPLPNGILEISRGTRTLPIRSVPQQPSLLDPR